MVWIWGLESYRQRTTREADRLNTMSGAVVEAARFRDLQQRQRFRDLGPETPGFKEAMDLFRQVEQRLQPGIQVPPEEPGLDRLFRNIFRKTGQVLGANEYEREAFLPSPQGFAPPLPRAIGAAQTALRA